MDAHGHTVRLDEVTERLRPGLEPREVEGGAELCVLEVIEGLHRCVCEPGVSHHVVQNANVDGDESTSQRRDGGEGESARAVATSHVTETLEMCVESLPLGRSFGQPLRCHALHLGRVQDGLVFRDHVGRRRRSWLVRPTDAR